MWPLSQDTQACLFSTFFLTPFFFDKCHQKVLSDCCLVTEVWVVALPVTSGQSGATAFSQLC